MKANHTCSYCEGKGYVEIRDCTGEVQREETCMLCSGTGKQLDSSESDLIITSEES